MLVGSSLFFIETRASGGGLIVNGCVAYERGVHTGIGSGRMLRYRRSAFGEVD